MARLKWTVMINFQLSGHKSFEYLQLFYQFQFLINETYFTFEKFADDRNLLLAHWKQLEYWAIDHAEQASGIITIERISSL